MAKQITNIEAVEMKSKTHEVVPYVNGFKVTSGKSNKTYFVILHPIARCNCKWAQYQPPGSPVACSHVMKARAYAEQQNGYKAKFRAVTDDIKHLHRKTETIGNGVKLTLRRI